MNDARGMPIPELKTRQAKNRKLKELKTRAQKALYFAEQYGLEITSLGLKSLQGETNYKLGFTSTASSSDTPLAATTTETHSIPSSSNTSTPTTESSTTPSSVSASPTTPPCAASQSPESPSSCTMQGNSTTSKYSCLTEEEEQSGYIWSER